MPSSQVPAPEEGPPDGRGDAARCGDDAGWARDPAAVPIPRTFRLLPAGRGVGNARDPGRRLVPNRAARRPMDLVSARRCRQDSRLPEGIGGVPGAATRAAPEGPVPHDRVPRHFPGLRCRVQDIVIQLIAISGQLSANSQQRPVISGQPSATSTQRSAFSDRRTGRAIQEWPRHDFLQRAAAGIGFVRISCQVRQRSLPVMNDPTTIREARADRIRGSVREPARRGWEFLSGGFSLEVSERSLSIQVA